MTTLDTWTGLDARAPHDVGLRTRSLPACSSCGGVTTEEGYVDSAHFAIDLSDESATYGQIVEQQPTVRLSIVMPAHNEERLIATSIRRLLASDIGADTELIVVDDGSTDSTGRVLAGIKDARVEVHTHAVNLGKGAAVRTGAAAATGTHLLVFDADLEYAAADIPNLLDPVRRRQADVVYGTRLFGQNTVFQSFRHAMGNRFMTLTANVLFDAYISDLHTCLKLIPLDLFRELHLTESGFGLDTEITAELLRRGIRPFEVPVSYVSRTHADGKQIIWRDGVRCLVVLCRVRARRRSLGNPSSWRPESPVAVG